MINPTNLRRLLSRPLLNSAPFRSLSGSPSSEFAAVAEKSFEVNDKTGIVITLQDLPGKLSKALETFSQHNVGLTRIESRPTVNHEMQKAFDYYIDFKGQLSDDNVSKAIRELGQIAESINISDTPEVPWFPTQLSDLNKIG